MYTSLDTTDILGVVHVEFTLFSRRVSEVEAAETRAELRQAEQKVISHFHQDLKTPNHPQKKQKLRMMIN